MRNLIAFIFLFTLAAFLILLGDFFAGLEGVYFIIVVLLFGNLFTFLNLNTAAIRLFRGKGMGDQDPHQLRAIVAELSEKAGIPAPKIYFIETDASNIFTTGRSPKSANIVVTTGLLNLLKKEEITAIFAQTIAHISHKNTFLNSVVAMVAGSVSGLANVQLSEIFLDEKNKTGEINKTVMSIVAPIAALMIRSVITPQAQFDADATAAKWADPLFLVSGLEKLETNKIGTPFVTADRRPATAHLFIINPIHDKKLEAQFQTHPPTDERIRRLKMMTSH